VKNIPEMELSMKFLGDASVCPGKMNWIEGSDRQPTHLLPATLEDYIGPDNVVRFLDAFVATLDLRAAGCHFSKADPHGRGRPAYHPADLLKLYLYGYLHQRRSSRRLEAECRRHRGVLWRLRQPAPDFKTIADFRKDNAAAFQAVGREFTRLCRQLDLFGGQRLAMGGTKIKAQNAPDKNWSQTKLDQQLAPVEARLEEHLKALGAADVQPAAALPVPSATEVKEKIARWQERQTQIQERLQTLVRTGETQLSATDPDRRTMKSHGPHVVGYNPAMRDCVEARHPLLVTTEVTNTAADQGPLAGVAQAAKTELQITQADVVADGGYYQSQDIKACQDLGLEPHLPAVENSPSERAGHYGKSDFRCDATRDVYPCPGGAVLSRRQQMTDPGKVMFPYDHPKACGPCPLKVRCPRSRYRTLSRWEQETCWERMAQKVATAPGKLAARKTLIEHCWGTVKWLLPGGFLVRGKVKVGAEVSLAHLGCNLKRALAVVGLEKLLAAWQNFKPDGCPGVATAPPKAILNPNWTGVMTILKTLWRRRDGSGTIFATA